MWTIVLASRKGGAGKTTLAIHLAVEAERAGDGPVVIIDADPMGGASGWHNARKIAGGPRFIEVGNDGLKQTLEDAKRVGVGVVVIDTPPAATNAIGIIIAASDLVIVPVIPSPNDLRAVGETIDRIEEAGKPLLFVLNNASVKARLTGQASRLLSSDGPVAQVVVASRQDYRSAMTDGRSAAEIKPQSLAAKEIAELWKNIISKLETGDRRGKARIT